MIDETTTATVVPTQRTSSTIALSAGFALTGAGTVMMGVLLPVLSLRWGLRDDQAGLLLFLQFVACALGAIVTGRNRVYTMTIGYGLLAATLGLLAIDGSRAAYAAFFLYGLGLGMAMTSTSLLFANRWGDASAAKLEWLNFVWSAGATAGPVCFLPLLRRGDLRSLFVTMAALSFAMLVWVVSQEGNERERHDPHFDAAGQPGAIRGSLRGLIAILLLLTMITVGMEAALSGWLTTYSQRVGMHSLAGAALATSMFWLGEMASRLVFSTRLLAKVGRGAALQACSWGVAAMAILIVAAPRPSLILVAAAAAGAFVGPLYPLQLSFLLELSPWGWFFAVGGIGAAFVPWVTGLISANFHSLRLGMTVPCLAGFAMIALNVLVIRRITPENSSAIQ
ncbi:MAG: MFS transporter [Terracidiphilus sp.]|jgi:fucose permease